MSEWILITSGDELRKPLIYPFHRNYKCKGAGFFFDGKYGYYGTTSHTWDMWIYYRNTILNWFGLMCEWRCDGSGKSRIVRQRRGSDA